jgi:N-acetylneuraminic acid mutarotase
MYVGVAAAGGRLFVVGGFGTGADARAVHAYDPAANAWETLEPLPSAFSMPNVAGVGNKLYVLGALDVRDVLEYDLATRRWTAKAPLPVDRGRGVAAVGVWGTTILVAGGILPGRSANMLNTGVRVPELLAYDTAGDRWERLPDMALPRGYAMGAVIGDLFWVAGGSTDFVRTEQVDAFDLKARMWVHKPPLPVTLSSGAVAVLKGRMYIIGGIATSTGMIVPDNLALDPATGTWTDLAPMPTPRFATGAAAIGDRIYVPTGAAMLSQRPMDFGAVSALEAFVP